MDISDQFNLEHLYLTERTCRTCGETKDLIDSFYRTYSYECKSCTIKRIMETRKNKPKKKSLNSNWEYPDW